MIVDLFAINSSDYVVDCKLKINKINMFPKKVSNLKNYTSFSQRKKIKEIMQLQYFFVFPFDTSFGTGFGLWFLKSQRRIWTKTALF